MCSSDLHQTDLDFAGTGRALADVDANRGLAAVDDGVAGQGATAGQGEKYQRHEDRGQEQDGAVGEVEEAGGHGLKKFFSQPLTDASSSILNLGV